jgi:methylated-DNA-[protein]-cysteine S-methyltransferase
MPYEAEGWGLGDLWVEDGLLVWHELPRPAGPPHASTRFQPTAETHTRGRPSCAESGTISELVDRLGGYFAGERSSFDEVLLDLTWCTRFQRNIADALREVGWGETVTYGELAALAGFPNAQRAAGTFCARNRFPILVPCHRVVAADGIGSYGSLGIDYKRRLLELEGVTL